MSILNNSLLLGAPAGVTGYTVARSLRFNAPDNAYLSRTFSSGNQKTWTWSGWVKKNSLLGGNASFLFGVFDVTGSDGHVIDFNSDTISLKYAAGGSFLITTSTTSVLRDLTAWMHIVVAFDTTQSVQDNRLKIYVNNVLQTLNGNTWALSTDYPINGAQLHGIGRGGNYAGLYLNAYLAEVHFIDGQAKTPSDFAQTDATTGQWIPKAYTGTYGTNGFKLTFSDNSATTATTLGKDSAGSNNWTPNNFSVAAGAGNDSLTDTPTSYGSDTGAGAEVRGNYAVLNPLSTLTTVTLTNGNLDYTSTTVSKSAIATIGISSGKWYWEVITTGGTTQTQVGVYGTSASTLYSLAAINTVYGIRFDVGVGTLEYTTDGTTWTSIATGLTAGPYFPYFNNNGTTSKTVSVNFGQRTFTYTASGFKALCDTNLPEGTITTSGTFTGNANADGPFVWLNGVPTAMTINSNAVTFGTHADKLANGFKLRTNSTSYNTSGSNSYSITTTGAKFKYARAQANP